jgi:fumarate reductase flavoprotein subunit
MASSSTSFDVIVVGGGMAGLAAALSAVEYGARTMLVEKSNQVGGNASIAAGMFLGSTDFTGLNAYIPDGDPALQRTFCADFMDSLSWLEAQGLAIGQTIDFGDFRKLRPMAAGRPGDRQPFMTAMAKRAASAGIIIQTNTQVRDLRLPRSMIVVDVVGPQDQCELTTSSVILACGGFASNRMLLEKHLGHAAQFLRARSLSGAGGDGIILGQKLGASMSENTGAFYGHTMVDCALEPADWQPMTPYFARLGVLVNRNGRRFVDESASLLEEANAQAGFIQPAGKYWLLFDERIRMEGASDDGSDRVLPTGDWLGRAKKLGAPLFEAPTIAALVTALGTDGVEVSALEAELRGYNAACEEGRHESLRPSKRLNARPLNASPFYAVRCVAGITATCGGLAVDDCGRVLDSTRRPLPGLFAAGVDAGGVFGRTYGGFLAWAVVSGRRAGRAAAIARSEAT